MSVPLLLSRFFLQFFSFSSLADAVILPSNHRKRYVHSRALVPTSRVLADLGRRAKEVARERRVRRLEHQKQKRLAAARKIAELPVMTVTERDLGATTTTNAYANSSGATAMMTHTTVSFPDLAVASGRG